MSIASIASLIRDRWLYGLIGLAVGLIAAGIVTANITPQYSSTISIYVSSRTTNESPTAAYQGGLLSQQRVKTYTELALSSTKVLDEIAASTNYPGGGQALKGRLAASASPDSIVFSLTATDEDPARASAIANAAGTAVSGLIAELEQPSGPGQAPAVVARVVEPATQPTSPVSPNWSVNLLIGGLAGLAIGFGAAFVRRSTDTRVKDEDGLRAAVSLPILGVVPAVANSQQLESRSAREAFKKLRTNLDFMALDADRSRVFAITSSVPGEGKTSIARRLAGAIAESGRSVVVVDGDLRKPRLHEEFNLQGTVGLTTVLTGRVDLRSALQQAGPRLSFLGSGQTPPNPSELIGSAQTEVVLTQLREFFDVVVIDTPPLLPVTDGALWAAKSDGAVLVARYGVVRYKQLRLARESLETVSADMLGVVLNAASERSTEGYRTYGYYGLDEEVAPSFSEDTPMIGRPQPTARGDKDGRGGASMHPSIDSEVTAPRRFDGRS